MGKHIQLHDTGYIPSIHVYLGSITIENTLANY